MALRADCGKNSQCLRSIVVAGVLKDDLGQARKPPTASLLAAIHATTYVLGQIPDTDLSSSGPDSPISARPIDPGRLPEGPSKIAIMIDYFPNL